jgi:hypothetical protein
MLIADAGPYAAISSWSSAAGLRLDRLKIAEMRN